MRRYVPGTLTQLHGGRRYVRERWDVDVGRAVGHSKVGVCDVRQAEQQRNPHQRQGAHVLLRPGHGARVVWRGVGGIERSAARGAMNYVWLLRPTDEARAVRPTPRHLVAERLAANASLPEV